MTDPDGAITLPDGDGSEPTPERASGSSAAGAAGPSSLVRSLAALCIVFFVGAVAMAVLAAKLSSDLRDERGDRRAVERVSSQFAERLLTFDYRRLEATRAGVFSLSTGKFRREYVQAFKGLRQVISAGKTVSRGTVSDLFVGSVTRSEASAIAVVETATSGRAGSRTVDSYIQLDLVKVSSRWLVDGVTNLNFTQGGAPPAVTGTTATAPANS